MKFKQLLDELIRVSQKTKTDFALSMNMTSSGLSKMLSGKNIPVYKERYLFSRQAADFFAASIFRPDCYLELQSTFPVIYNFASKYELEGFLTLAIEYTLDEKYLGGSNEFQDRSDKGTAYLGQQTLLNMSCIIISDHLRSDPETKLEFFSYSGMFNQSYRKLLHRIRLARPEKPWNVVLNHILAPSEDDLQPDQQQDVDYLSLLVKAEQYFDLKLWTTHVRPKQAFLFLKGKFLLTFSVQLDGLPILFHIQSKTYLSLFMNSLMKRELTLVSYNRADAISLLEANPEIRTKIANIKIDTAYNCIPLGYLAEKEDLEVSGFSGPNKDVILQFFHNALTQTPLFVGSIEMMNSLYTSGTVLIPLYGPVHFSASKVHAFLTRFAGYMKVRAQNPVKAVNTDLSGIAIFVAEDVTVLYITDLAFQREKFHCLRTEDVRGLLEKQFANNPLIDVPVDIWKDYLDELASRKDYISGLF